MGGIVVVGFPPALGMEAVENMTIQTRELVMSIWLERHSMRMSLSSVCHSSSYM